MHAVHLFVILFPLPRRLLRPCRIERASRNVALLKRSTSEGLLIRYRLPAWELSI